MVNQHCNKSELTGERRFNKAVEICDELRRTSDVLRYLQGEDWPCCCGEKAEYVGDIPADAAAHHDYECWDDLELFVTHYRLED